MADVINPDNLQTGSAAISGTAAELLAAVPARGGVVLSNQTDGVVYVAGATFSDNNNAYALPSGSELALGDYRGSVFIRGSGSGRVHYAYTI